MKYFILVIASLVTLGSFASADEYVNGYYKKDGSYVEPYHRTKADSNPYNNYSTKGNENPYTGQQGTVDPNNYESKKHHTKRGY